MDGREGRRLGRDAAPRQGGRDQRALVQRALPDADVDEAVRRWRGPESRRPCAAARATRSTSGSGTRRPATCTTSWTARRGTIRPAARTRSWRSRCRIPCSTRERWEPVMKVVRERLLTPVGLRSLAPGDAGLQGALLRRSARPRRRLPPGHRLGLADRPVCRRRAEAAPTPIERGCAICSRASIRRLEQACVGQISEVFDAEAPFLPRGCVAQAWSVAEVFRCWLKVS